jgi:DNA-binding CsgD family transcriptional regulator/sugar-specific transcriptional regulator TrmB
VFEALGLPRDAEQVYRLLLANPRWTLGDIALKLGLPEQRVRECLDVLADLALLRPAGDGPSSLRAASPRLGLTAMLAEAEADVARRARQIDSIRAAINTIAAEHDATREQESITRLDGLDEVRSRLEEFATTVRGECLSFTPGSAHPPDAMAASKPLNQRILERGVTIKAVYLESFRNDPGTLAYARWLNGLGGLTRTSPTIPIQMVIVDRECALLPINPEDPRQGALEIRNTALVVALCAMFDQVWSVATPFGRTAARDSRGLNAQETEIVRLLSEGHTDESIARRLGLSVRSVRRVVAELTERLGASSRFQAGALAVRNGWI